ncbi:MAG TPA: twin-arginine translocase TatA/TatE family subunit [Gaiellaceae bacterium]|nr:twin-arginine translocase TatA/TatE family subunit [Gaiellaceae bacterium]
MVPVDLRPGPAAGGCYPETVPFGIGIWEILILLLVVLLVFGPKRLPEMGRSLGKGMREFKDSVTGRDDESPPQLPPAEDDPPVSSGTTRRDAASS